MKKNTTSVIVSIVVLLAIVASIAAGAYLGIMGRDTQMVTVQENGQSVERALYRQVAFIPNTVNKSWTEAIVPSAQLNGGYSYTVVADQGDMSDADYAKALKTTANIMEERVQLLLGDATAKVVNGEIQLVVPMQEYDSTITSVVTPAGEVAIHPVDTSTGMLADPIVTAADIKGAGYYTDNSAYYLQLELTSKAVSAINSHLGETLYVVLDGQAMAYTTMYSQMSNNIFSATASDWSMALIATVCVKTDVLPLTALTFTAADVAPATLGSLLDVVITVCGVIVALAAVWMIVRARLSGLAAAIVLGGETVLFWLLTALISVDAGWKMTVAALFVLVACQVLFIAGLVLVIEKIAAAQKHRALNKAVSTSLHSMLKPLAIAYGAQAGIGIVLMAALNNTITGVLGRMVTVSAVLSFVMIFVLLRVITGCFQGLKSNK